MLLFGEVMVSNNDYHDLLYATFEDQPSSAGQRQELDNTNNNDIAEKSEDNNKWL